MVRSALSRSTPVAPTSGGSAWTPGPWFVDPDFCGDVQDGGGNEIGSTWHSGQSGVDMTIGGSIVADRAEQAANARLIASAPDLYEALFVAVAWIEGLETKGASHRMLDHLQDELRAALSKATTNTPASNTGAQTEGRSE